MLMSKNTVLQRTQEPLTHSYTKFTQSHYLLYSFNKIGTYVMTLQSLLQIIELSFTFV